MIERSVRHVWLVATVEGIDDRAVDLQLPADAQTLIVVNPLYQSALVSFGFPEPASVNAAEYQVPVPPRSILTIPVLSLVREPANKPVAVRVTIAPATGESDPDQWSQAFSVVSFYASDTLMPPRVDRFVGPNDSFNGGYNASGQKDIDDAAAVSLSITGVDTAVKGAFIQNLGPNPVYLGDFTVSAAEGLELAAGATLYWPSGDVLFAICDAAGTADIRIVEVK